jgi:predicted O-linked N-acetylglucosamine transferase (SPINDLY family)
VARLDDGELARLIRSHEVDLLVDLAGHTSGNRLGCLAAAPAPLQASWIGYPNSTGLAQVSYFITDGICAPPDGKQQFAEQPLRLPGVFCCYTPPPDAPPVAPSPASKNGFVTFGSFNNLAKIGPRVLRLWSRILDSVNGARLLLKTRALASARARHDLWARLESHGIARERVTFWARQPTTREHLNSYGALDVSLDPWPYAGTTNTCESLLMGVPCITLQGGGHAQRVGASLLTAAGMPEWIAGDEDEYLAIAVQLAHAPRLAEIRAELRARLLRSALCDGPGFVVEVERAYHGIWERWRRGD